MCKALLLVCRFLFSSCSLWKFNFPSFYLDHSSFFFHLLFHRIYFPSIFPLHFFIPHFTYRSCKMEINLIIFCILFYYLYLCVCVLYTVRHNMRCIHICFVWAFCAYSLLAVSRSRWCSSASSSSYNGYFIHRIQQKRRRLFTFDFIFYSKWFQHFYFIVFLNVFFLFYIVSPSEMWIIFFTLCYSIRRYEILKVILNRNPYQHIHIRKHIYAGREDIDDT